MMEKKVEYFKKISLDNLKRTFEDMVWSYSVIYDMDRNKRDVVFIKELADILKPITSVLYVFARDKKIHPNYVLEKLYRAKSLLETHIRYWESKKEEEEV